MFHIKVIYHCTEPGGDVLLTVYTGKNEDDLTADAINPALRSREEYMRRKKPTYCKETSDQMNESGNKDFVSRALESKCGGKWSTNGSSMRSSSR